MPERESHSRRVELNTIVNCYKGKIDAFEEGN